MAVERLTPEEKETIILFEKLSKDCIVDTSIPSDWRKLNKRGWEIIRIDRYPDGEVRSVAFKAPRSCVTFKTYGKFKPNEELSPPISEERRRELSERMLSMHEKNG